MNITDLFNQNSLKINNNLNLKLHIVLEIEKIYPEIFKDRMYNFISKIIFKDLNDCWEYQINKPGKRPVELIKNLYLTHYRYMYYICNHLSEISSSNIISHKCHNRKCVNPNHLKLGTQLDNKIDNIKGMINPKFEHLMTYDKIEDLIKRLINNEFSMMSQIEDCYNIANPTYYGLIKLKHYKPVVIEICNNFNFDPNKLQEIGNFNDGSNHPNSTYNDKDFNNILYEIMNNTIFSAKHAAEKYNINYQIVYRFLKGQNRKKLLNNFCKENNISIEEIHKKIGY